MVNIVGWLGMPPILASMLAPNERILKIARIADVAEITADNLFVIVIDAINIPKNAIKDSCRPAQGLVKKRCEVLHGFRISARKNRGPLRPERSCKTEPKYQSFSGRIASRFRHN
jgi:hypothetical protein